MNTDEHRSSEAVPSCTHLGVGKTIWLGLSLVAPKVLLSVLICVHLWLKNFLLPTPKSPQFRSPKSAKTPAKPHLVKPRQA
jgi:hypothetical protein